MDRRSFLKVLGLAATAPVAVKVATLAPAKKKRVPNSRHRRGSFFVQEYPAAEHEVFLNSNSPSSFIPELWDRKFVEQFYGSSIIELMEKKQDEFTRVIRRMV